MSPVPRALNNGLVIVRRMKRRVTFFPGNVAVDVDEGETVLDAAVAAGVHIDASCGGAGTCGKCRVLVEGPCRTLAGTGDYVLACQTVPEGDLSAFIPEGSEVRTGSIHSSYINVELEVHEPLAESFRVEMEAPSLDDNLADLERLRCALGRPEVTIALPALRSLPAVLRSSGWKVSATVVRAGKEEIIEVRPDGDVKDIGAAIDIGTTTVALELVDLRTGQVLAQASDYNRQMVAGEDVLARIAYAEEKGPERLQELIIGTINRLVERLCSVDGQGNVRFHADDIKAVSVGANPAMAILLLGLDPKHIRYEPYIPAFHESPMVRAAEIGLRAHSRAPVYCIPGRAAYVGGDVTADVLLSGMHLRDELSLLIDVGTNGEVVLGNREWMVTCSTSAGPAFEGGEVSCGMRAMNGAIDSVTISNGELKVSTIGSREPVGICGSGLIDLVAQMFQGGWIDRKGRFVSDVSERIRNIDGVVSALVHSGEADILINEDDIANILRTKAAMYAGCAVLLNSVDLTFDDVDRAYIAGGFGSHINVANAQLIGLLPDVPRERFEFIGNGSLGGARTCLLSSDARKAARSIFDSMTYLDLSSSSMFFDQYSSALFLPHTDLDQFPSVKERLKR